MQDSLYYQEELSILRDLAAEFSREYPALAPMLAATGTDPDVERILEGTAYLSSFVKQRLDDEFPEIIQGLLQYVYPHYLRPVPSATLIAFSSPAAEINVPRGIEVSSVRVDDLVVRFTTAAACRVRPLEVSRVTLERHGDGRAALSVAFNSALPLADLHLDDFSIFVNGPYADAVNSHRFILDYLDGVSIHAAATGAAGTTVHRLPAAALSAGGHEDDEPLLPWPTRSFRCYRLLQEFYLLPEKFLFWRLRGLEKWVNRGTGNRFTVRFELARVPERIPEYNAESLILNVVPAVNVFPNSAEPIRLDHHRREYPVVPQGYSAEKCQVYSVRRVGSRNPIDNVSRDYLPVEKVMAARPAVPVYSLHRRRSENSRVSTVSVSVVWPALQIPQGEIMSMDLLCTNGDLPSQLRVGDVRLATESSPPEASFRNVVPPTAMLQPPLGKGTLWRLLSYFHVNLTSLASREALRKLLALHVFQDSRDRLRVQSNLRRVEAVEDCRAYPAERLIRGVPLRGRRLEVTLNRSGFAAYGDMRIFGEVLDHLFAEYASMNCFTETRIIDAETGEYWQGKPRLGQTPLV